MTDEAERRKNERRSDSAPYAVSNRTGEDRRINPPRLEPCKACGSLYCGPIRCRFDTGESK